MAANDVRPYRHLLGYVLSAVLCGVALGVALWSPWPAAADSSNGGLYTPSLSGRAVKFDLSGMEPDFDPIYSVVISATLHDGRTAQAPRSAGAVLPDTMLVLSMYLESFKPDTTPILPDLLHPNTTATSLVGFLQGKAVLVNAGGQIVYRGSTLAEIFRDNSVHTVMTLYGAGANSAAPPLKLSGIYTLYQGGTERGSLQAAAPLPRAALAALVVPRGPSISWQSALSGVTIRFPKMVGTGGNGASAPSTPYVPPQQTPATTAPSVAPTAPARVASAPASHPQASGGSAAVPIAVGAAALLVIAAAGLWARRRAAHSAAPAQRPDQ